MPTKIVFPNALVKLSSAVKRILSLILLAYSGLALADDWPNWRGPWHDGVSREKGWTPNFSKVAWRAQVGVGFSSFAVADPSSFALADPLRLRVFGVTLPEIQTRVIGSLGCYSAPSSINSIFCRPFKEDN